MKKIMTICLICILCGSMVQAQKIRIKTGIEVLKEQNFKRLGLDAGAHFFETVMRPEGAIWIAIGFAITFIPVVIMALVALRMTRLDFGSTCGMLCGSMANPMALNYANDTLPGDNPAVSYATVYPLSMFSRVIIAQLILMFFI